MHQIVGYVYDGEFYEKWGIPRQGLCTSAKALIKLSQPISLVEPGQPVLILFLFHLNTSKGCVIGGQSFAQMPSKVHVPKCAAGKQSVFATRTPHRPNPIGLTIAYIQSFDHEAGLVGISGCDLIVGTPILDVMPYQSGVYGNRFEHVNFLIDVSQAKFPRWVTQALEESHTNVCIHETLSDPNHSYDVALLRQILSQDVRSRRSRTVHGSGTFCHTFGNGQYVCVYRYTSYGVCVIAVVPWNKEKECIRLFGTADLALRVRNGITSARAPEVLETISRLTAVCSHR